MAILAIDLSSKSTGWSVFRGTQLLDSGCIQSSSTDPIKRIYIMRDGLKEVLIKYNDIDKIILEEVRPENGRSGVMNTQTHRILMWCQAAVAFMAHDFDRKVTLEYIYPSSWRAAIGIKTGRGIKRTTLKEKDIQFVKENYNLDVNDDEADAICIGYSQCHDIETEINWE